MSYLVMGIPAFVRAVFGVTVPADEEYTNSMRMKFVRIEAGSFMMGMEATPLLAEVAGQPWRLNGDFDEHPAHQVVMSKPFYMGTHQVTNAEYEQFDPEHKKLRGKLGFSKDDDEAVVFVSWHDAVRFCEWLSEKDNLPYRLPTEAEWEYACRSGAATPFHTGDTLPESYWSNPKESWYPDGARGSSEDVVPIVVCQTPPNFWGLYDMHGNVEDWCYDWYGPYEADEQIDPVGRVNGHFRVTRGGSHSTEIFYLRSANRMGTLPDDKHWLIGFRLVMGEMPETKPLPVTPPELWQHNVKQNIPPDLADGPDPDKPYLKGPRQYVNIPPDSYGQMFSHHNHDPAIVACPNGDLLAVWYTCMSERGRELGLVASRLRYGSEEWEPAASFWNTPDRNNHAPALWNDGKGTLYFFNGLSAAATWGNLATIMRTSKDNGVTWSLARLIVPEHGIRHMPIESVSRTQEGYIVLPCDAVTGGSGGTALWISRDEGETWEDAGGTIAGIHAGAVQLRDGRLMAFGRGDNIDDKMPKSVSDDMGKTWTYSPSIFQPIGGGQRLVLLRLMEGPLFFASFGKNMIIECASGQQHQAFRKSLSKREKRQASGLFGALSFDEGETWPVRCLITDDGKGRPVEAMDGRIFDMSMTNAEPAGYMSVCQSADGVINLISSRQHYAFNVEWLKTSPQIVKIFSDE